MEWLKKTWDVIVSTVVGILAAYFVAPDIWSNITSEVVAFLAIQAAAVLPAMIFTVGVLRPDGLSIREVDRFQYALRAQMRFWIVLFILEFVSAFLWILAKAFSWKFVLSFGDDFQKLDISGVWSILVISTTSLALLRTIPFIRGVLSLLDLTGELTKRAIKARTSQRQEADFEFGQVARPDSYGEIRHH